MSSNLILFVLVVIFATQTMSLLIIVVVIRESERRMMQEHREAAKVFGDWIGKIAAKVDIIRELNGTAGIIRERTKQQG